MGPSKVLASQRHIGLMRCHITIRLALLTALLCAGPYLSLLSAQTAPIVLIQDSQGRQVYINPSFPAPPSASSLTKPAKTGPGALERPQNPIPEKIQSLVEKTAGRFQVDPKLVDAIIRVESGFNAHAVSSKGAEGLMQLIPPTAERFGVADPFDSGQNIQGGVTFLRYLLDRFNDNVPLSLAAYNAGENRVDRDRGIPAIPETVNYVRKVTSLYRQSAAGQAGQVGRADQANRVGQAAGAGQARGGETPIYRYVDAWGVAHYSND
ncbi:MAG: lytic transglycosylase domain-containing protein [Terriglobia bacterium]